MIVISNSNELSYNAFSKGGPRPTRILLSTAEAMRTFRRGLGYEEFVSETSEERLLEALFEHLSYQQEAQLIVPVFVKELVADHHLGLYAESVALRLEYLARTVVRQLELTKAYEQGYLFYRFVRCWGADLLLEDFRHE